MRKKTWSLKINLDREREKKISEKNSPRSSHMGEPWEINPLQMQKPSRRQITLCVVKMKIQGI